MPKHIAWREGLFIRPQHFQQSSYTQYNEMMLRTKITGVNMWGLTSLDMDDQLLSMGKVSCMTAEGILPDGTLFSTADFISTISIDIDKSDEGKSIYLSLSLNNEFEDNTYFEEQEEKPTRYVAKTLSDVENTNINEDSKADITFAYPNLKLFKETKEGYAQIEIAKISAVSANNSVTLDSSYEPTYLHLHKALHIRSKLDELKGIIRNRAEKLLEKISTDRLKSTELRDYLILQLLNKYESKLHYYNTQENIHPGELYLELSSFIAELTVFMSKEKRLSKEYTYIHKVQYIVFETLFFDIKTLLGQALESSSSVIPLDKHKFGVHIGALKDKSIWVNSTFVLAITGDLEANKLKKLLVDNLKIGSVEEIRNLVNHHLPGFKYTPLATAPKEVPYRVNNLYFALTLKNSDKENLLKSSGIALHFPDTDKYNIEFILWSIRQE